MQKWWWRGQDWRPAGEHRRQMVRGAPSKREGQQSGTAAQIWALESDSHSSWVILGQWVSELHHTNGWRGHYLPLKDATRINDNKHLALSFSRITGAQVRRQSSLLASQPCQMGQVKSGTAKTPPAPGTQPPACQDGHRKSQSSYTLLSLTVRDCIRQDVTWPF